MTKQKEKEEPLTKEEAEKQVADLPPAIRATLDKIGKLTAISVKRLGPASISRATT
jgi:hypothetical protein